MHSSIVPAWSWCRLATLTTLVMGVVLAASSARAADQEFVGLLAAAIETEMAERLGLTDDQLQALHKLADEREDKVVDLALRLEGAPPEQRERELAPFRRESEALALELLSPKQRTVWEQIRIARAGMQTLTEPAVVAALSLTPEQRTSVTRLLVERQRAWRGQDADERDRTRDRYERELFNLLSAEQRAAWQALAGEIAAAEPAANPTDNAPAANTTASDMPANPPEPAAADADKPAVETPTTGSEPQPADMPATTPAAVEPPPLELPPEPAAKPPGDGLLRFSFRYQPWADVLDWFAEQADVSLVMDAPPPGTFNYTDTRSYTPAEAIDLLNSVLLTKGYTLVRRERMLMVINLEDGIPPNLVPFVPLEQIDRKGEYELITSLFTLNKVAPEEAEQEITKLIGPQGSVVVLPKSRQLQVTETAGRLRMIRDVLRAAENPGGPPAGVLREFKLAHAMPDEVMAVMRRLMDIPDEEFVSTDGSVRVAVDPLGNRLLVSGSSDTIARVDEIMQLVDIATSLAPDGSVIVETPQLEVYPVVAADPTSVLAVLQTLMASAPDVRLATDPLTGHIVALARPSDHRTIRATIDQLQRDARQVEVIALARLDPQTAVQAINNLFGAEGDTPGPQAPRVDADPLSRQLLIRGTESQLAQIRQLLEKMGERSATYDADYVDDSTVRMIPLTGSAGRSALERIEAIWPTLRGNRIRIVTPSAAIPEMRPSQPGETSRPTDASELLEQLRPFLEQQRRSTPQTETPPAQQPAPTAAPANERSVERAPIKVRVMFANQQAADEADAVRVAQAPATPPAAPAELPPIVVAPGPGGIMIASEDVEALNDFEDLLNTLASYGAAASGEYTVYYLVNASADTVAETLGEIFGATSGGGGGGGGSLLGDLAGAALGGGGLMGTLLGMGGGGGGDSGIISASGLMIVPETRLNALIVQGTPANLDLIEQMLKVLDQPGTPDNQVSPRPRLIPVVNTNAATIAQVVREVYQENIAGAQQQRQPSPEQLLQLLGGGRGRGGSSGGSSRRSGAEIQKMSIGVDARTNSLVVSAPQPLFEQVEQLVKTLDQATPDSSQSVRVVTLRRSNPETVQKALMAIAGEKVKAETATSGTPGASSGPSSAPSGPPGGMDAQAQEQMRQRMEFFNQLRSRMGGDSGGRGGPIGSGAPGGGPPGGGDSRGRGR